MNFDSSRTRLTGNMFDIAKGYEHGRRPVRRNDVFVRTAVESDRPSSSDKKTTENTVSKSNTGDV